MSTECNQFIFGFHTLNHREIRAQFDGGAITTEGGGLLPTDSANVTSTPESSPCSSPNRCALRFFLSFSFQLPWNQADMAEAWGSRTHARKDRAQ